MRQRNALLTDSVCGENTELGQDKPNSGSSRGFVRPIVTRLVLHVAYLLAADADLVEDEEVKAQVKPKDWQSQFTRFGTKKAESSRLTSSQR